MFRKSLIVLALCVASVFPYSYTIFPPITGAGVFAVNPVIYAENKNLGGMEIFMYYGLTDKLDISTSISETNGMGGFASMLRYDFGGSKIMGLRMNPSWISPHFNVTFEGSLFYFQGTIASQITFDYADKPAFYGILCPGIKLFKNLDLFCEVNPGYYMYGMDFANCALREKGFEVDVTPGIGLTVGKALFSISVPIYSINRKASPTFGAWVYYSIKGYVL